MTEENSPTHYQRLFETAQDGILILNAQTGDITDANPYLLDLLGYDHPTILGKKLWELGLLKDTTASQEAFAALQRTGYIRYDDLPLETRDGRHVEVEFVSNVYPVGVKQVIQCNIRNVNERKRLELLKNDYLSTVSHEIRVPVAVLQMGIGDLEDCRSGNVEKEDILIIAALKRNTEKLAKLTHNLLDLSQFESRKIPPALQIIHIRPLIEEVIQDAQENAKMLGLTLHGKFSNELPSLQADPDLLQRVLTNLRDNALRFAKSKVIIAALQDNSSLQVCVSNDGPAIKAELIPTLFSKFVQIDRPLGGTSYKGIGLGLHLCHEIIKIHQGKIWAESATGCDTRFCFSLPLQAASSPVPPARGPQYKC